MIHTRLSEGKRGFVQREVADIIGSALLTELVHVFHHLTSRTNRMITFAFNDPTIDPFNRKTAAAINQAMRNCVVFWSGELRAHEAAVYIARRDGLPVPEDDRSDRDQNGDSKTFRRAFDAFWSDSNAKHPDRIEAHAWVVRQVKAQHTQRTSRGSGAKRHARLSFHRGALLNAIKPERPMTAEDALLRVLPVLLAEWTPGEGAGPMTNTIRGKLRHLTKVLDEISEDFNIGGVSWRGIPAGSLTLDKLESWGVPTKRQN